MGRRKRAACGIPLRRVDALTFVTRAYLVRIRADVKLRFTVAMLAKK
jgi:hypothetical protein